MGNSRHCIGPNDECVKPSFNKEDNQKREADRPLVSKSFNLALKRPTDGIHGKNKPIPP